MYCFQSPWIHGQRNVIKLDANSDVELEKAIDEFKLVRKGWVMVVRLAERRWRLASGGGGRRQRRRGGTVSGGGSGGRMGLSKQDRKVEAQRGVKGAGEQHVGGIFKRSWQCVRLANWMHIVMRVGDGVATRPSRWGESGGDRPSGRLSHSPIELLGNEQLRSTTAERYPCLQPLFLSAPLLTQQ